MQLEFRLPSTVPSSQNPTAEREQESQSEQEREAETKPVDKPGSGRGSSLNFITFTKPNKPVEKSSERRLIRSHVLRDYHAKRRSASRARLSGQLTSSAAQIGYDQASSFATAVSSAGSRPAAPIDPFVSSAIALSKLDKYYLHHFFNLASDIDSINSMFNKFSLRSTYVPTAMQDPVMLTSLLDSGSRHLGLSQPDKIHDRQQLEYRGRLINLINSALSSETGAISQATIAGTLVIQTNEYTEGNSDSYHLHAKALQLMVESRGGLDTLGMGGALSEMILSLDITAAAFFSSKPYYPQNAPMKTIVSIDSLNSGFLSPSTLSNLSEELIGILNDLCVISDTMNREKGTLPASSRDMVRECERRLLSICGQRRTTPNFLEVPELHQCTVLAAMNYFWNVFCGLPISASAVRSTSRELLDALSRLLTLSTSREYLKMSLWLAFMGTLAVDTSEGKKEWLIIIERITDDLEIHEWSQVSSVLKSFLWLEPRSEVLGKSTWLLVEAGKLSNSSLQRS